MDAASEAKDIQVKWDTCPKTEVMPCSRASFLDAFCVFLVGACAIGTRGRVGGDGGARPGSPGGGSGT